MTPKHSYICPKCSTPFERDFWSESDRRKFKGFCSRACANSKTWTPEINEARSAKLRGRTPPIKHYKKKTKLPRLIQRDYCCPECKKDFTKTFSSTYYIKHFKGHCSVECSRIRNGRKVAKQSVVDRHQADFDSLHFDTRRKIVIAEQTGICSSCGLSEWLGKPLTLEIDHINGDHSDHRRENLTGVCPNCHSLTPTWRGRNKRTRVNVSDETLKDALNTTPNIHQALLKVGMTPKGANYQRALALKHL